MADGLFDNLLNGLWYLWNGPDAEKQHRERLAQYEQLGQDLQDQYKAQQAQIQAERKKLRKELKAQLEEQQQLLQAEREKDQEQMQEEYRRHRQKLQRLNDAQQQKLKDIEIAFLLSEREVTQHKNYCITARRERDTIQSTVNKHKTRLEALKPQISTAKEHLMQAQTIRNIISSKQVDLAKLQKREDEIRAASRNVESNKGSNLVRMVTINYRGLIINNCQ